MSDTITFTINGQSIHGEPGDTILTAADRAGVYIPRLCHKEGLEPQGACRLCTVLANGRPCSACTQPVAEGVSVESETDELRDERKALIEMLFVEGNHFCMFCEKSGDCELQALGYRFGITAPKFPYQNPHRDIDASHPDIILDRNRCILCARCVRASRDLDGKNVFEFIGRGSDKRIAVNSDARLIDTSVDVSDQAMDICPVGALMRKHSAYRVPIGQRQYDCMPIGSDIEIESATADATTSGNGQPK